MFCFLLLLCCHIGYYKRHFCLPSLSCCVSGNKPCFDHKGSAETLWWHSPHLFGCIRVLRSDSPVAGKNRYNSPGSRSDIRFRNTDLPYKRFRLGKSHNHKPVCIPSIGQRLLFPRVGRLPPPGQPQIRNLHR